MHAAPLPHLALAPLPPPLPLPEAANTLEDQAPNADGVSAGAEAVPDQTSSEIVAPAALVILGRDDRGRPHASRFALGEGDRVAQAAGLMGLQVLAVEGGPLDDLTAGLPAGRLFASGKAFVPFCGENLFNRLVAYLPVGQRPAATGANNNPAPGGTATTGPAAPPADSVAAAAAGLAFKPGSLPGDWDKIKLNSIVLATLDPSDGWWPAVVTELKPDGLFVLKWAEWEDWEPFLRRAEQLALLHPAYAAK